MADIVTIEPVFIGSPAIGVDTYQLPSEAMTAIGEIINATWNLALEKSAAAEVKAADISTDINTILATPGNFHVTAGSVSVPSVTAPGVVIPTTIDVSSIMATFDSKYIEVATFLTGKFTDIITTYFPNDTASYSAAETWLTNALASNQGIPSAVQQQAWGDDHARISSDKLRAQDAVIAQFAARRFPLTPDVAASAVLQIEQKAQDELAESSRKIAIASVENLKWAVEKVVGLRQLALGAAGDYVKSLASAPDVASRVLGIGYDAQSKLISSASSFYTADTNAKEMMSKVAQWNETIALDAATKNQAANLSLMESKVRALLADFAATMQAATASLNNLHVSAGMSVSGGVNGSVVSS
jgi:hypothetical protein